jgi:cytochrome c551
VIGRKLLVSLGCRLVCILFCSLIFSGCGQSATDRTLSNKFTQYYRQGEQLYSKHCSNCHQASGTGLGRVYPPIHESDFMNGNFNRVLCLIRHGIEGELTVNGVIYNQAMPGIPSLTDLEVAQIATYIYNTWSHSKGLVDVKDVSRILNECNN